MTDAVTNCNLDGLPPVLTVEEAAQIARCCPKHIRDLLREGAFKGAKLGTVWRINTASFLEYLGLREAAEVGA